MACCAFAVFLILNLLIPLGLQRRSATSEKQNPVVAWRFQDAGQITTGGPDARNRLLRPATAVFAIYLACVAILSVYWLESDSAHGRSAMTDEQWDAFAALNVSWCLGSLADAADNNVKGAAQ